MESGLKEDVLDKQYEGMVNVLKERNRRYNWVEVGDMEVYIGQAKKASLR